jgi:hypothetical protein
MARSVTRSDGKTYPSILAAARDVGAGYSNLHEALQLTKAGCYRCVKGFQWADSEEVPEVWPVAPQEKKRPVVNSRGERYEGVVEAARETGVGRTILQKAIEGTESDLKRIAGGCQWAYEDNTPETWPIRLTREKPHSDPSNWPNTQPIYPPKFTEKQWCKVPSHPEFEVSTFGEVRRVGETGSMPKVKRQKGKILVRVGNHFYDTVSLMMLAFVGVKPFDYTIRKIDEDGQEVLSNLYYALRDTSKPRKKRETDD